MTLSARQIVIVSAGAAAALIASFLAGRLYAPTRVEVRAEWKELRSIETHWAVRTEYQDRTKIRTRVVMVERLAPDGSRETTTTTDSGTDVAVNAGSASEGQSAETATASGSSAKVTDGWRPGWSVGVGAEWDPGRLSAKPDRWNVGLERRLFGTVWLGVRGSSRSDLSEKRVGLSARMEF